MNTVTLIILLAIGFAGASPAVAALGAFIVVLPMIYLGGES